jgi:hypothetical protein
MKYGICIAIMIFFSVKEWSRGSGVQFSIKTLPVYFFLNSFSKDKPFIERYPDYRQLFSNVKLHGITNSKMISF